MIAPKNACTGCSACMSACPVDCIKMEMDTEGFLYPAVDESVCINCRNCRNICPVLNKPQTKSVPIAAYGARLSDSSELYNSASGGAFYSIACRWLDMGAQIWGASFDESLNVVHSKAESIEELQSIRKSKYAQSDLGEAFQNISDTLKSGRKVLFSGTPCQIAGLVHFLDGVPDNLFLVQVFCAHVLSPGIWNKYVKEIENEHQAKITHFEFRFKQNCDNSDSFQNGKAIAGWKNSCLQMVFSDGRTEIIPWEKDILANAFMDALLLRPSCTECQFKLGMQTYADIAIGDFWGCENVRPDCFDPRGVSALIAYSSRGQEEIEALKDMVVFKVDVSDILRGNPDTVNPRKPHLNRTAFFEEYKNSNQDVISLIQKYNGFLSVRSHAAYRFGLFGSYNTRMAIISMCKGSDSSLAYQYSNSSIISLFSSPVEFPKEINLPANPFRKQMLLADFNKNYVRDADQFLNVDYLVIDFIEERFDLLEWKGSFITDSDALHDTCFSEGTPCPRLSADTKNKWFENCDKLIDFLQKNLSSQKVILVRALLSENYIDSQGKSVPFENLNEIKAINNCLNDYYDYFETKMPQVLSVSFPRKELMYCEKDHKHGVLPCHMNRDYVYRLAGLITDSILKNNETELS